MILAVEQLDEVYKTPKEKAMFIKYTRFFLKPKTMVQAKKMLKDFKRDVEIIRRENHLYFKYI